ncbi:TetR/AcrR family transcriptional regulator [Nocardia sp. BMG111209]|uniref:TetR/AcrR family transcriptional regulator n=1 Tax=Nocardia sp. BMG111209 TaxID=1160137 RepID=UPI00036A82FA|nr:TetR/AcrR family transcriptional regulator [Nocardia sp. BMG111209]
MANPTRRRIIDATVASILENGFYRATSNEIARRAGLTWGAIQRQFGTREAVMFAVFEEEWGRLPVAAAAGIQGATVEQRVRTFFRILAAIYERPEFFAGIQVAINLRQDPKASSETLARIEQMSVEAAGALSALVRQLQPGVDFDSATADLLLSAVRDFHVGLHIESVTAPAAASEHRRKNHAAEQELLVAQLLALVRSSVDRSVAAAGGPAAPDRVPAQRVRRQRRDLGATTAIGRVPLDFALAKYSPRPGGGLRITYVCDAGNVRQAVATGIDSPLTAGRHVVTLVEGDRVDRMELIIRRRDTVFDLTATVDGLVMSGVGIADPECPESLLISWSWGAHMATGIAKYTISDEPHTITATYLPADPAPRFDGLQSGRATGLTANGFLGSYTMVHRELGTVHGPYTWIVSERGDALELTWDTDTRRAMEGFGFRDPDSARSVVGAYWTVGPRLRDPQL